MVHNSLFELGWNSNKEWTHTIKMDKRKQHEKSVDENLNQGERISLTLRTIDTYLDEKGRVFGQGGTCKTQEELDLKYVNQEDLTQS